ncbi:MAG: RNA-guided endonuclease InsQ/TnpB family protein [Candidatus Bathycorpusculaceae bacterium]
MKVKKTIQAKIVFLTKIKQRLLEEEYENLQRLLHGEEAELYSANKQQAKRFYRRIKPDKEYPLSIRKDLLKIERRDTKIAEYWARIPVKGRRGGVWVAIKPHCPIEPYMEICESKLFKRNGDFYLHIVVEKEVEPKTDCDGILAVDLGIHNIAVTVNSKTKETRFYGKKLRAIRGHYFHLRRNLPNRKAVKKVGNHEKRIVNHELHIISKAIVQEANRTNSAIILGKLKGLRKNGEGKGRRFRRKLNNFPYNKLASYIQYKAEWLGIPVLKVSEAYTSQTCSICGGIGFRRKGLFKCQNCETELNADYNGAKNIMKRGLGLVSKLGVEVNQPRTAPTDSLSPMMRAEAPCES